MDRAGIHKRWKPAFLVTELLKRLPEGRADAERRAELEAFLQSHLRDMEAYVAGRSARGVVEAHSGLKLHGLYACRAAALKLLRGDPGARTEWIVTLQYGLRAVQLAHAWLQTLAASGQAMNPSWVSFADTMATMAACEALGWQAEARALGLSTLALMPLQAFSDANPELDPRYEKHRNCFPWFALRLQADASGWQLPARLPEHPFAAPAYERMLAVWRTTDAALFNDALLAVCDWHTHECMYTSSDRSSRKMDFVNDTLMGWPLEVHLLYRLRERAGLPVPPPPVHPLLGTPMAEYPSQPEPHVPDTLLDAVTARLLKDVPLLAQMGVVAWPVGERC